MSSQGGQMSEAAPDWGQPREKSVTWYDPAILLTTRGQVSGREILQSIADGRLPAPPMANLIGVRLVSVREGEVTFQCAPDESTYNPIGIVHGGLLCALLDFAAGAAVDTLLPAASASSSVEIKVSYLKPIRGDSGTIEAVGRVLRLGGRVAFSEAHARDASGELLGHATSSLAIVKPIN